MIYKLKVAQFRIYLQGFKLKNILKLLSMGQMTEIISSATKDN